LRTTIISSSKLLGSLSTSQLVPSSFCRAALWLQPHFRRLLLIAEKACPKGACSKNWPPYKTSERHIHKPLITVALRLGAAGERPHDFPTAHAHSGIHEGIQ